MSNLVEKIYIGSVREVAGNPRHNIKKNDYALIHATLDSDSFNFGNRDWLIGYLNAVAAFPATNPREVVNGSYDEMWRRFCRQALVDRVSAADIVALQRGLKDKYLKGEIKFVDLPTEGRNLK